MGTRKLSPKADGRRLRKTESGPSCGVQRPTWRPGAWRWCRGGTGVPARPRGSTAVSPRSRRCHLLPAALRKPFIWGQLLSLSCCHRPRGMPRTVASAFVSTELKKPGEGGLAREARAVTFQSDPGLGPVTREQGQWGPWGSRRRRERGEAGREEGSRRRGSLRRVRAVWHLLYEEIPVKKNAFSPKDPAPWAGDGRMT